MLNVITYNKHDNMKIVKMLALDEKEPNLTEENK